MSSEKTASQRSVLLGIVMFFFVVLISVSTYFVVQHIYRPKMLIAPANLSLESDEGIVILSWDKVNKADWYTIKLLNRTDGTEWNIPITTLNYTINQYNKVEYNLTSDINLNSNYSIRVRSMSEDEKIESSGYCVAYEFEQVDPVDDLEPLNT